MIRFSALPIIQLTHDPLLQKIGITDIQEMIGPIYNTNWVIKDKLLVGCYPGAKDPQEASEKIEVLLREGITDFISLQTPEELERLESYEKYLPDEIKFHNFPIPDRKIVRDDLMLDYLDQTIKILRKEDSVVYLHCLGGHGRSGVMVDLILAANYGATAEEALKLTQRLHDTRWIEYEPRKKTEIILKSPQTKAQINQVKRLIR